jgi:hypothetical protein
MFYFLLIICFIIILFYQHYYTSKQSPQLAEILSIETTNEKFRILSNKYSTVK